jgi:hypothetical protein
MKNALIRHTVLFLFLIPSLTHGQKAGGLKAEYRGRLCHDLQTLRPALAGDASRELLLN